MLVNTSAHIEKFIEFENNRLIINKDYYKIDPNIEHAVNVKNLDFKYFNSEDYIFKNINLTIQKGNTQLSLGQMVQAKVPCWVFYHKFTIHKKARLIYLLKK